MKTEIEILKPTDINKLNQLISVFEEVFEMNGFKRPGATHLQKLLDNNKFLAIVAKAETSIVAGLTIYVLDQYYSEKKLAYIYDLAVLGNYQRMGIGRQLIEFAKEYCEKNGFEELFVQADKADDYAIDFYRSTKPTVEEEAFQFSYHLSTK